MQKLILFFITIAMMTACSDSRINQKMIHIKEVGDTNPNLAKIMLDSLEVEVRSLSKHTQMTYELLDTRLKDKADIIPTSDINIKEVLRYFINYGNEREKQEAYYYAGSVYRDLNDYPRALEYFLQSCKYAENIDDCDSVMLRNAYSNLSFIYNNVQDYKNDLLSAQKEYDIEKDLHIVTTNSLTHLAQAYFRLDSIEKAKEYFKIAFDFTRNLKSDTQKRYTMYSLLGDMATLNMQETHACHKEFKALNITDLTYYEYAALANYFVFAGNLDSAIVCNNYIIEHSDDIIDQYDATRQQFQIYQKMGDMNNANYYANKFMEIHTKYDKSKRQEIAATTNNRFQYHRNKEEEERIKKEKNRYMFLSVISVISLLLFVALFTIFYIYKRNKSLKHALEMAEQLSTTRIDREKLSEALADKEEELSATKRQLDTAKQNLQIVNDELETYDKELKQKEQLLAGKIEQNKSLARMLTMSETEIAAEEIISRIRKASEGLYSMKSKDWRGLYNAVDELHPDFRDTIIRNLGNFTEQEMQICYLMRAGLSNHQIQNVMPMSRATVWRWTKRMYWIPRFVDVQNTM